MSESWDKFSDGKVEWVGKVPLYRQTDSIVNNLRFTSDQTLTTNDHSGYTIYLDSTSGDLAITLPSTSLGTIFKFIVEKTSSNSISFSPAAIDLIVGLGSGGTDNKDLILAQPRVGDQVVLVGDGSAGWFILPDSIGTFTREA